MKLYPFEGYIKSQNKNFNNIANYRRQTNPLLENSSLKGVILNTKIKNSPIDENNSNDVIYENTFQDVENQYFDTKKAIKPLAYLTLGGLAVILGLSYCFRGYSKTLATDDKLIRPGDLPRSMNILQEQQLATFRALRDPSKKNLLGLGAVGLMSAFTLVSKNFAEGIKDIWIKKQKCDIEADYQKSLIDIETSVFKGKLAVVDKMCVEANNLFNNTLNDDINFKSNIKNEPQKNNKNKAALGVLAGIATFLGLGFLLFKNCQKTASNLDNFMKKMTDKEIKAGIDSALKIENKDVAIDSLVGIFKRTNMDENDMRGLLSKVVGICDDETGAIIAKIKQDRIFASAPEALGGVKEKIQYYCYVDEERGFLYNWVLNPENKFNKYLFLSFCLVGSIGYLSKNVADAIKNVAVERENTKTELNLKKKLVNIEINNFKAKKESAINPLIENYKKTYKQKTVEERQKMADNILFEIKNGPPYIYS